MRVTNHSRAGQCLGCPPRVTIYLLLWLPSLLRYARTNRSRSASWRARVRNYALRRFREAAPFDTRGTVGPGETTFFKINDDDLGRIRSTAIRWQRSPLRAASANQIYDSLSRRLRRQNFYYACVLSSTFFFFRRYLDREGKTRNFSFGWLENDSDSVFQIEIWKCCTRICWRGMY